MEAMQPEFEDETPINPFDFWQGANFKLKIVKKDGYWNYDKSEFGSVEPLLDDDDALEAIWKKEYSLAAVTTPDQFKSYEELEKRLKYVLGQKGSSRSSVEEETEYDDYSENNVESAVVKELEESYARSKSPSLPVVTKEVDDDEDDALAYFSRLADE
jgi:NAD(P)H-flavin reductase